MYVKENIDNLFNNIIWCSRGKRAKNLFINYDL